MNNDFIEILQKKALENKIYLNEEQLENILKYKDMIFSWNEKVNLTRITGKKDFVEKHVIDSMMISKLIKINRSSKIIDIGTGPGIPGIFIKIARPDIKLILLEAVRKKAEFLCEVVKGLNFKDVEIVNERAETAARKEKYRERQDMAVARAVSSLKVLLEICLPFIKKDGIFIAMKGEKAEEEIEDAKNSLNIMGGEVKDIVEYKIGDMKHKLIVIKKIKNTPEKYPRRPGMPEKNPL